MRNHHTNSRPWDVRRPSNYYKYNMEDEEEDNNNNNCKFDGSRLPRKEENFRNYLLIFFPRFSDQRDPNAPAPCVGLCYLKKLQALENRKNGVLEAEEAEKEEEEEAAALGGGDQRDQDDLLPVIRIAQLVLAMNTVIHLFIPCHCHLAAVIYGDLFIMYILNNFLSSWNCGL